MKLHTHLKWLLSGFALAGLAACGGGGGSAGSVGTLRLALTDAPACGYNAVNVTIQKVRVHQSSTADPMTAQGWSEIVLNPARRVNLLTLQNGVLDELGQLPLASGKYTQMRLVLADNDSTNPLANSVKPTGGSETALTTPSGQQSGVKANVNIDIAADKMADFVIDFDACKSVVTAGNSGKYLLKPVVSVIPRYVSGVAGSVDASLVAAGANVSLQQGGMVVKAAAPGTDGKFLLRPVAPGSYTLVLTAPGKTTAVVTGVPVVAETVTSVGSAPLNLLAANGSGVVNGTAPDGTLVRVLQPLTVGPSIEVGGGSVDSVTLAYSFSMPLDAPQVAPYVAPPTALVFAADTAAAAKYTLSASLTDSITGAKTTKTATLPALTASAPITTNFTFP